ncbi:DUF2806 domain-containing protein [Rhizobiaceae bacterium]|nr:DUF2806 domain-containing protein [Rhizobiaceae bacterium]
MTEGIEHDETKIRGGVFESLSIPKVIAGPAGDALSRLLGNGADLLGAKLARAVSDRKDQREARSIVSKAIAEKTAEIAVQDADLMERAKESFVNDLLKRQSNKEAIAEKVAHDVVADPVIGDVEDVGDDWLNVFSKHAENASSERMREHLARILAGEIRAPGSYSTSTIRLLAEIDRETLEGFQRAASHVFGDCLPASFFKDGQPFKDVLMLLEEGLLTAGTSISLSYTLNLDGEGIGRIVGADYFIFLKSENPQSKPKLEVLKLTKRGADLCRILRIPQSTESFSLIASELYSSDVEWIKYSRVHMDTKGVQTYNPNETVDLTPTA